MYQKISVPVDLQHKDHLDKAIQTAADLARTYQSDLTLVAITVNEATPVAHNPEEFKTKMEAFTQEQAQKYGVEMSAKVVTSHDIAIDLDDVLDKVLHELGTDLVVMASHIPGYRDYVFTSNAGYIASHADMSVMVVR
ncbi:MAG: universal stress protein [Thiolinea sp.]